MKQPAAPSILEQQPAPAFEMSNAGTAIGHLAPLYRVYVFFSHGSLTDLHAVLIGFQFFGHKDGQCRVNALSHFRFGDEDRDLIVRG